MLCLAAMSRASSHGASPSRHSLWRDRRAPSCAGIQDAFDGHQPFAPPYQLAQPHRVMCGHLTSYKAVTIALSSWQAARDWRS
jgi:hypothetical protein